MTEYTVTKIDAGLAIVEPVASFMSEDCHRAEHASCSRTFRYGPSCECPCHRRWYTGPVSSLEVAEADYRLDASHYFSGPVATLNPDEDEEFPTERLTWLEPRA